MKENNENDYSEVYDTLPSIMRVMGALILTVLMLGFNIMMVMSGGMEELPRWMVIMIPSLGVVAILTLIVTYIVQCREHGRHIKKLHESNNDLYDLRQEEHTIKHELRMAQSELEQIDNLLTSVRLPEKVAQEEVPRKAEIESLVRHQHDFRRIEQKHNESAHNLKMKIENLENHSRHLCRWLLCLGRVLFNANAKTLQSKDLRDWRRQLVTRAFGLVALLDGTRKDGLTQQMVMDLLPRDAARDVFASLTERGHVTTNPGWKDTWSVAISLWLSGGQDDELLSEQWNMNELSLMVRDWPYLGLDYGRSNWNRLLPGSPDKDTMFNDPAYKDHLRQQMTQAGRIIGYWPDDLDLPDGVTPPNGDQDEIVD